jgi:hypothetical protein
MRQPGLLRIELTVSGLSAGENTRALLRRLQILSGGKAVTVAEGRWLEVLPGTKGPALFHGSHSGR